MDTTKRNGSRFQRGFGRAALPFAPPIGLDRASMTAKTPAQGGDA